MAVSLRCIVSELGPGSRLVHAWRSGKILRTSPCRASSAKALAPSRQARWGHYPRSSYPVGNGAKARYALSVLCSRIRENSGDQKVSGHFGPKSHDFGYTCCLQFLAMDTLSRYWAVAQPCMPIGATLLRGTQQWHTQRGSCPCWSSRPSSHARPVVAPAFPSFWESRRLMRGCLERGGALVFVVVS